MAMATGMVPLHLHNYFCTRLSFLSTVSNSSVSSLATCQTRFYVNQGPNFYQNVEASISEQGNHSRREILSSFGATTGMALIWSSSPGLQMANAANLIQQRQRREFLTFIKDSLETALQAHPELVPSIMKLALNDAVTYEKASKTGGANGSIRLSSELTRPENEGLLSAVELLDDVKKKIDAFSKGGPLSYADLIQFAGQAAINSTFLSAAIQKCGGDESKGRTMYSEYSNGQWDIFERQFGRSDVEEADPIGRVLLWEQAPAIEMKHKFRVAGLGPRQLVVMSAFIGPDQAATEAKLATDPDLAPWVEIYQRSRETVSEREYEIDLINAFMKISCLGQVINYDAYTYPPSKLDLIRLNF